MKIGILAIATPEWGGVYQYTQILIQALATHGKHDFFIIKSRDFVLPPLKNNNCNVVDFDDSGCASVRCRIKMRLCVYWPFIRGILNVSPEYRKIKAMGLDLILSPVISTAPFFMEVPYGITIHDLQHKYHPDFFTQSEVASRDHTYPIASRHAKFIICESNYVENDIKKFLNIPAGKIRVVVSPPFQTRIRESFNAQKLEAARNKYKLPEKFLFYPAHFWPHKNHIKLIESIVLLKEKCHEKVFLVLVGSKQNNYEVIMHKIRESDLEGQISYLGYVPEEDMACLYRLSTALVLPTLFESVSLPIWEAFFLGVPVISSNICALPEQVGDAGMLFDPHHIEDMAAKIMTVWQDKAIRQNLIQRGFQRIENMTLENYAKQWEDIIGELG